jgi:hypothetical protein
VGGWNVRLGGEDCAGDDVAAIDLEVYAGPEPPPGYTQTLLMARPDNDAPSAGADARLRHASAVPSAGADARS